MNKYIGVKIVKAEPMSEYNFAKQYKDISDLGNFKSEDGYLVEYEDGYISWSPKDVFEKAYRRIDNLNFGLAIEALKKGHKIARKGWNGKDMWIALMPSLYLKSDKVNGRTKKHIGNNNLDCQPYIVLWTAQNKWQPGWVASQQDVLAEDWIILKGSDE